MGRRQEEKGPWGFTPALFLQAAVTAEPSRDAAAQAEDTEELWRCVSEQRQQVLDVLVGMLRDADSSIRSAAARQAARLPARPSCCAPQPALKCSCRSDRVTRD